MDDKQSEEILDWIGSDEVVDVIRTTNNYLEIYGADQDIIPGLISKIADGELKTADFHSELQKSLGKIDAAKLDVAVDKIKGGILSRIDEILSTPTEKAKQPKVPPPAIPTTSTSSTEQPAPFILHQHEEEELEPRAEKAVNYGSPIRPIFYNMPNSSSTEEVGPTSSKPIKARLELGVQEEGEMKRAQPLKPQTRDVRHVNYSELRTKLNDPFAAQTKIEGGTTSDKTEVEGKEPDLKDLPL